MALLARPDGGPPVVVARPVGVDKSRLMAGFLVGAGA
jgi:hypothetical protein